jgi:hypothetical protein
MIAGADSLLKVLGGVQPRPDGWTALLVSLARRAIRRCAGSAALMRDLKG